MGKQVQQSLAVVLRLVRLLADHESLKAAFGGGGLPEAGPIGEGFGKFWFARGADDENETARGIGLGVGWDRGTQQEDGQYEFENS